MVKCHRNMSSSEGFAKYIGEGSLFISLTSAIILRRVVRDDDMIWCRDG